MTPAERLAAIRNDLREKDLVARRISERREERLRVEAKLAAANAACAYEQADVDRLTRGLGGALRGLVTSDEVKLREVQELAAAKLLCEELEDDLRALDSDLQQLDARAAAIKRAAADYEALLKELGDAARARGLWSEELDALERTELELRMERAELLDVIDLGGTAHDRLHSLLDLLRRVFPTDDDDEWVWGEVMRDLLFGVSDRWRLRNALTEAQHALHRFRGKVQMHQLGGLSQLRLEDKFPEVGGIFHFLSQKAMASNSALAEGMVDEISRLSSGLVECVSELRGRVHRIDAAMAELTQARATLLDPPRHRL